MTDLRASDADRDLITEGLRTHHAAGRLDDEELEQRLAVALAARTQGELARLVADLPPPPAAPRAPVITAGGDEVTLDLRPDAAWRRVLEVVIPALVGPGGYTVVDQQPPHWIALEREQRPWWTYVIAVLTFPLGLLALLITKRQRAVLSVADAGGGRSRIAVTGPDREVVTRALARLRGGG